MKSLVNQMKKLIRLLFAAFLSIALFFSCNSPQEDSDIIDYSSLEELSTELVLKIGESKDYIPDYISNLAVTRDGTILVHDGGSSTIKQFDSNGQYIGTVAREGRGPGELNNVDNLHLLNGDTLIARNRSGRKDYFARGESDNFNHINTVQSNHSARSMDIVEAVTGDKFYAVKNNLASQYMEMKEPKATIDEAFVVVNEKENILDDSVHVLEHRGSFSVELEGGGYIRGDFPFQTHDQAVPLKEGNYLIARPDSSAFFVYNEDHSLKQRIPVNVKERSIRDEDLEYRFERLPGEAISEINKMRPDIHPPYYKIFASDNYFWLQTMVSEAGKEIVVLDFDGEPVGKFLLPEHESITYDESISYVEDGRIYTINSSPERGYQIRVYEIDLSG